MNPVTAALLIAFVQLIGKYGVPAALKILQDWGVTDPSLEQIQELKERVPRPETFFDSGR